MSSQDGWAIKGPEGVLRVCGISDKAEFHLNGVSEDEWRPHFGALMHDVTRTETFGAYMQSLGYTLVPVRLVEIEQEEKAR